MTFMVYVTNTQRCTHTNSKHTCLYHAHVNLCFVLFCFGGGDSVCVCVCEREEGLKRGRESEEREKQRKRKRDRDLSIHVLVGVWSLDAVPSPRRQLRRNPPMNSCFAWHQAVQKRKVLGKLAVFVLCLCPYTLCLWTCRCKLL